ncbi:hypothetical protein L6164_032727 [Bauhinia variegata]|uniref:Uncharacterized protein n=1 Tax=Bauhinia variegata TaxID=167791 RepID=A0ACB9KPY3_BAUVA|nr:hypothetical protein L6164_032727 [Bauhinia variegata]
MAEEFQAEICGGNWWNININSTRGIFPLSTAPCSMAANEAGLSYGTWQTEFEDLKPASTCAEEETNNFVSSNSSLCFLDLQKAYESESASGSSGILIDSTLQMMGFGLSSPSTSSSDWNHYLLSGRPERNFHSLLQEETIIDSSSPTKSFTSCGGAQVSTINDSLKPMNQEFPLDQQNLSSGPSTVTFPIDSSASYGFPASLIQSLYEPEVHQQQPQHSLFTNRSMAYSSSTGNYVTNSSSDDLSPTWSNKVSPFLKPKQQLGGLHFSNNTPFWNASADAVNDLRARVFGSSQPQYDHQATKFDEKHNCSNHTTKAKSEEAVSDSASTMKKSKVCEPAFKRPRIETPSPLPTFKVRKEKMGDRITALQQLVSPFGKTDTASVLHEAIEYIKFLHDQVNVLSTPYLKNGAPIQHQEVNDNVKESEESKQDLRSRGLCLVPISSTFPVATETAGDFWTPTFGDTLIR